ncbi:MAG: helix-turn-helix transcriptional regulator [Acidobacteria bacterium]|nr:helix-turn-helix transcriptional regulator [Acidobacteriota bacterium]
MKHHFGCPVQATTNALAGKWKVQIVWHLAYGPRRFSELRRLLPGVSEKVLSAQLRELKSEHLVHRASNDMQPLKVVYSLSLAAKELLPALHLLCTWGTKHLGVPSRLPPLPLKIRSLQPKN